MLLCVVIDTVVVGSTYTYHAVVVVCGKWFTVLCSSPVAATFGIALPSWIVDKKNSGFVLALYVAVFMIALPVVIVSG